MWYNSIVIKRKETHPLKYLMFDTETTNDIECPLCYAFGFSVIDEKGTVYEQGS